MNEAEQWLAEQQTRENQHRPKSQVEQQATQQDTVNSVVVFVSVVLRDVFHEHAAEVEQRHLAGIKCADKHAHQHPGSKIAYAQVRKNVWGKEQRQDETPAASQEIKERV